MRGEERSLPWDQEAERTVLGACMMDPWCLLVAMEKLTPEDFYLESHRTIFAAAARLQLAGKAVDLVTMQDHLRESGELEKAGGTAYLASLVDPVPDTANVEHHAAIVKDKSIKRRLMQAAFKIISECAADRGEAREVVDEAQRSVLEIAEDTLTGGPVHVAKLAKLEMELIDRARGGQTLTGLDTGFIGLNTLTSGLQRKDYIVLAARPSMGKTSLALNICTHAALRRGAKVVIFSLEMSSEQLVRRMLASEARVDLRRISTGYLSKQDRSALALAAESLEEASIWIDDTPGITVLELLAKARRIKQEHGLDLVMVDYLQLMSGGGRFANRNEEVSAISRGLKAAAKELDVPMLVLSQLSRQPERRGEDQRPRLSDLRESGSIEQDADVVIFIVRKPQEPGSSGFLGQAEIIIAKQRNGPVGEVTLLFRSDCTRFENADFTHGQELEEEEGIAAPPY